MCLSSVLLYHIKLCFLSVFWKLSKPCSLINLTVTTSYSRCSAFLFIHPWPYWICISYRVLFLCHFLFFFWRWFFYIWGQTWKNGMLYSFPHTPEPQLLYRPASNIKFISYNPQHVELLFLCDKMPKVDLVGLWQTGKVTKGWGYKWLESGKMANSGHGRFKGASTPPHSNRKSIPLQNKALIKCGCQAVTGRSWARWTLCMFTLVYAPTAVIETASPLSPSPQWNEWRRRVTAWQS